MTNVNNLNPENGSNYYLRPYDSATFYQPFYELNALDFSHIALFLRKNEELMQELKEVKDVCAGLKAELQRQRNCIEKTSKSSSPHIVS